MHCFMLSETFRIFQMGLIVWFLCFPFLHGVSEKYMQVSKADSLTKKKFGLLCPFMNIIIHCKAAKNMSVFKKKNHP